MSCEICSKAKHQKKIGLLQDWGPTTEPFQFIHIDTIGGFRESFSQLQYFHVAIDAFSGYVWGIASKTQNVQDFITNHLFAIINTYHCMN